jgi:GTP diphosphokinase / guanosine-3',5'-bis(diphosphate) 3'-diphosphatase
MADTSTKRTAPDTELEQAQAALRFARRVHLGQHRKQTHEQYVEHPIAVADLLAGAGFEDRILVAAYLHDVVEKTRVESAEIRERFGPEAADLVEALSEDPDLDAYADRKRALRKQVLEAGRNPTLIYAADRVANLRDWLEVVPGERVAIADRLGTTLDERLQLWTEDLRELTEFDPELPFLAEIEVALRELKSAARTA